MRRREVIAGLALAGVARTAQAQPPRPVIGVLLYNPGREEALVLGLRDVGLIDSETATLVVRRADGHAERLPRLAAELAAAKPDVLVTAGPQPIAALKAAAPMTPIVMAIEGDPVRDGFVRSVAHPGGNITGLSMLNTELSGKRVELLREIAPSISRVAVFHDPTQPQGLPETATAAGALGLDLQVLALTPDKIASGFAEAQRGDAQALLVLPTPFYNLPAVRQQLGTLALRGRLPSMCEEASYVRDGCLVSYGPDFAAMWRRSAVYVRKILDGAKPADLPVEQPTKFELAINLKTAKALGLTVPQLLLAQADEVIE
jgi:ABC-type uncharacterized transport system substrate-binding protein